jgi:hypothetical protein
VLRAFLDDDRPPAHDPGARSKRLVVLDHLAQLFEPGERFEETEVNRRLRGGPRTTSPPCAASWWTTAS